MCPPRLLITPIFYNLSASASDAGRFKGGADVETSRVKTQKELLIISNESYLL